MNTNISYVLKSGSNAVLKPLRGVASTPLPQAQSGTDFRITSVPRSTVCKPLSRPDIKLKMTESVMGLAMHLKAVRWRSVIATLEGKPNVSDGFPSRSLCGPGKRLKRNEFAGRQPRMSEPLWSTIGCYRCKRTKHVGRITLSRGWHPNKPVRRVEPMLISERWATTLSAFYINFKTKRTWRNSIIVTLMVQVRTSSIA